MGITNTGNQTISFSYKEPGKSENFNKSTFGLFPKGFYSGGTLTYLTSSTIRLSTFSIFLEDSPTKIGVRISTGSDVDLTVGSATPYIIIRYVWLNAQNNYADVFAVASGDLLVDDIIVGKCVYNGANVLQTTFDYTKRTTSSIKTNSSKENNFKVEAEEPYANTVYVNGGNALIEGVLTTISSASSPTISATTLGRIDLVYLNSSGVISVLEGTDSGSPVSPTPPTESIILGSIIRGSAETVIRGDQITQYSFERELVAVPTPVTPVAADINITDTGTYFTGTEVETALQEIGAALASPPANPFDQSLDTTDAPTFTGLDLYDGVGTADRTIDFDSDASILWDESEDLFDYSKGLTIEGVHKKIFANTTNLLLSKDAEDIRTGVTFEILATWVSQFRGSIRLYLQHHSQSGNSVEARVVKNGIQLELWSTTSTGYVTRTYDIIDLIPGDVITWEHRATAISDSYLRYCRIYAEDLIIDTMVIVPNAII